MNLFEIDAAIMAAFEAAVDQDTGEILDAEAYKALDDLQEAWDTKVENIACWIKNLRSDAKELKEQKMIFAKRQAAAEKKADSLENYLERAMDGQKFKSPRVSVGWRRSEQVVFKDEKEFVELMQVSGMDCLLKYTAPVPIKDAVKDAIKNGTIETDLATIEIHNNIQIR